jgi:hypothetical protein
VSKGFAALSSPGQDDLVDAEFARALRIRREVGAMDRQEAKGGKTEQAGRQSCIHRVIA